MQAGYYNLRLDERSSYLTIFSCPFDRYRYIRLPLGAAPADNMFQKKIDELLGGMLNVFGIGDDILITGSDEQSKDHQEALEMCSRYAGR